MRQMHKKSWEEEDSCFFLLEEEAIPTRSFFMYNTS